MEKSGFSKFAWIASCVSGLAAILFLLAPVLQIKIEHADETTEKYLVNMGIDESRIYIENRSVNTNENIAFSADIIKKNGLNENMAIVTDGFHEMRAALIAKRMGYECGAVSSKTPLRYVSAFTTREVIALTAALLLNR